MMLFSERILAAYSLPLQASRLYLALQPHQHRLSNSRRQLTWSQRWRPQESSSTPS